MLSFQDDNMTTSVRVDPTTIKTMVEHQVSDALGNLKAKKLKGNIGHNDKEFG